MVNDSFSWIDSLGSVFDVIQNPQDTEPFCIDAASWWDEPLDISNIRKRKLEAMVETIQNHLPIEPVVETIADSVELPFDHIKRYTLSGPNSRVRLKNRSFYEICNDNVPNIYLSVSASWIASFKVPPYDQWKKLCLEKEVWKASKP